ncbi:MAG: tetratricopeptide repeat protein [Chromatiaceae bacterium]|nr:MAG: tetratricopeptide repeat protein [Chromatiaceae bacterium]
MTFRRILRPALPGIALATALGAGLTLDLWPVQAPRADSLAQLPETWQTALVPIPEVDISGAEPLMQEALRQARAEVAKQLVAPTRDPAALATAYGRLGALFLLLEVEAPADAALRNATALQPQEFRWPYYAGYLAMLAGNLDEAIAYLERARAIDPNYPALYIRLGKVRLDRGDLATARIALERVRDVPEIRAPAHYYLGQVALLERDFEGAIALLQEALKANPQAREVHYPLAQAYRALGDSERAKEHLARFELRAPEVHDPLLDDLQHATARSQPAFQRGLHAVRNGHYGRAVEEFAAGLAVDPDNAAARVSYARALFLNDQCDAAEAALATAMATDPNSALAPFLHGVLLQARGDLQGAAVAYRDSLAQDPQHPGALFYLANLDFAAGRFALAAVGYEATLLAAPETAPARVLAQVAALHAGVPEARVAERLEARVAEHPDDRQLRYALARLLAAAATPEMRDPAQAMRLAAGLLVEQPIPPHKRAVALADAANGRYQEATAALEALLAGAGWLVPPAERTLMEQELAAYRAGRLPQPAWPLDDPLLAPPPFDPQRPFRDYPAANPY